MCWRYSLSLHRTWLPKCKLMASKAQETIGLVDLYCSSWIDRYWLTASPTGGLSVSIFTVRHSSLWLCPSPCHRTMLWHRFRIASLRCTSYSEPRRPSSTRSRIRSRSKTVWLRLCRRISYRKRIFPDTKCWIRHTECRWPILAQSYITIVDFSLCWYCFISSDDIHRSFFRYCCITSNDFYHCLAANLQRDSSFNHGCPSSDFHWIGINPGTSCSTRCLCFNRNAILDSIVPHHALSTFQWSPMPYHWQHGCTKDFWSRFWIVSWLAEHTKNLVVWHLGVKQTRLTSLTIDTFCISFCSNCLFPGYLEADLSSICMSAGVFGTLAALLNAHVWRAQNLATKANSVFTYVSGVICVFFLTWWYNWSVLRFSLLDFLLSWIMLIFQVCHYVLIAPQIIPLGCLMNYPRWRTGSRSHILNFQGFGCCQNRPVA